MNTLSQSAADGPQRAKMLGAATLAAVLLHGLALYGVPWETASAADAAPRERGVTLDLAPAPAPPSAPAAPAGASPPAPAVRPEPEAPSQPKPDPPPEPEPKPVPAPKKIPPKPARPRRVAPQASQAPQAQAPRPGPAPASRSATPRSPDAAPSASPVAASSPEPLASRANPKPAYPELARKRGQQGLVRLLAHIDEQGKLTELSVAESSGFSLLDEAALKAVRRWKFKPALRAGTPVRGTVLIPVEFVLERR